jgi:hypothetical protein
VRVQGVQAEKEVVMDEPILTELQNEVPHMDEPELIAFGRRHRANPESVEYLEAKAEWKRRQQKKAEIPKKHNPWGRHLRSSERCRRGLATDKSICAVRIFLWLLYTLIASCFLAVISLAVYRHASETPPTGNTAPTNP